MVLVKNDCYKVHRGDEKAFGEALYRCSYLAKVRGKGYGSLGANNYSGSRVQTKKRFEHHINRANLYTFFDLK